MSEDHRLALSQIIQEIRKAQPGLKPDKFFELFTSELVLKASGIEADPDELRHGVVGGGGDGGIDGFFCYVNRRLLREDTDVSQITDERLNIEVFVVQASTQGGFSEDAVTKFSDFARYCLRLPADHAEVASMYRDALLAKVAQFRAVYSANLHKHPSLKLRFAYCTQADRTDQKLEIRRTRFLEDLRNYFIGADADLEFAGADTLLRWFNKQVETTLLLPMEVSAYSRTPAPSYVGLVKLRDFYTFITDDTGALREHLFESNVRHFQGMGKVNQGIQDTLKEGPGSAVDFWWLNNGVTIVATRIGGDIKLLSITDPLIVNGLQTSFVIHDHFLRSKDVEDNRMVMVRVIVVSDAASMDAIIKATNSQTYIPPSYLHATEDIHRNIETVFRGRDLFYDRRKGFHRRAGVPSAKIVPLPYLAQAIAAIVLRRPNDARARPTGFIAQNYKKIFPPTGSPEVYVKCAQVMKRVEEFLDNEGTESAKARDLRFYLAMVAVCEQLENASPRRDSIARVDVSLMTDAALRRALYIVDAAYRKHGGNETTAKGVEMLKTLETTMNTMFPKRGRGGKNADDQDGDRDSDS